MIALLFMTLSNARTFVRVRTRTAIAAAAAVWLTCVAGAGVTALRGQGARTSAAPPEMFDEVYERGQRTTAGIKTLTAHFIETTTSSLLTTPLVAKGTLAVERPARVIVQYETPEPHVVLIDGNRMTLSWPGRRLRQVSDIGAAQGRVQKYFLNGTAAELRKQFDIDDRRAGERPGAYHVSLVAKRRQIRETLAQLDLWVERSSSLLSEMQMRFANGDTKTMTFDHVVPNAALAPGTFTVAP
jgi:outer membrane lipoprotein-sorting protein